ncbi:MAG: response regulator [Chloroflexi bacterium]|nr:MAG: response regulator [Chloroflexota bacterium]
MKTPLAVTGRPSADSHAAYMTAPIVNGRIRRLTTRPAPSVASSGVTKLRSVIPPLDCCRIEKKDAKATPKIAADGMARMTEIPANRTKCRRYMRNVSSSTSPISIGRMRSGAGTLKYSIPSVSYRDRLRVAGTKDWAMNQRAAPAPDDISVLFVEDDASVAQMYRLKLELDGYSVDVAADGLVALEKARATHPDIIFLDIRLPKMDGLEVLEALRADTATAAIPVVILSNWNEKELVERGVKLGALDHLIKSQTTPARLSQRLKDLLHG